MPDEVTRHDGSLRVVGVGVAGARAVAQLRNRVVDLHGPLELDVRHWAVFVDVASGAVGPERGEFPGGGLAVRDMAAVATNSGAVIHVGRRCVPVCHRRPERGPVTGVAR